MAGQNGDTVVVEFDPYTYPGSPQVETSEAYFVTVLSVALFYTVNSLAKLFGPPNNFTSDVWRWRNTFVSWIHAIIVGFGCLYCIFFKPEVMAGELILYCDKFIYGLLAVSFGYFVYDLLDHVVNKKTVSHYEVIIHHTWVIMLFWYHLHYRVFIPFSIMGLAVEVNSIFLHARKLMHFDNWPYDHWLYQLVVVMNLVTFLWYRIYTVVFITANIPAHWNRITVTYRLFIILTMFCLGTINVILFWRIVKNDVLRHFECSKKLVQKASSFTPSKSPNFQHTDNRVPDGIHVHH